MMYNKSIKTILYRIKEIIMARTPKLTTEQMLRGVKKE